MERMIKFLPNKVASGASFICWLAALSLFGAKTGWTLETVWQDGAFSEIEWTTLVVSDTSGSATIDTSQDPVNGNPDACRLIVHRYPFGQLGVGHLFAGAVYDPVVRGAITNIEFSYDARAFDLGSAGKVIFRPFFRQNGTNFFHTPNDEITQTTGWVHFARTGLTQNSFCAVGACSHKPDFSTNAAPIQFGFFSFTPHSASSNRTECAVDNWSVRIRSVAPVRLHAATGSASSVTLCWLTDTDAVYRIQFSTNVLSGDWTNALAPIAGTDAERCETLPIADAVRVFRILRE